MRENPTLFHRAKSVEKIIYWKVTYSKFSAAKVEGYRKSGKVRLWIANCAIFYNFYKEKLFDRSADHK